VAIARWSGKYASGRTQPATSFPAKARQRSSVTRNSRRTRSSIRRRSCAVSGTTFHTRNATPAVRVRVWTRSRTTSEAPRSTCSSATTASTAAPNQPPASRSTAAITGARR
jgi:hypothetical protein